MQSRQGHAVGVQTLLEILPLRPRKHSHKRGVCRAVSGPGLRQLSDLQGSFEARQRCLPETFSRLRLLHLAWGLLPLWRPLGQQDDEAYEACCLQTFANAQNSSLLSPDICELHGAAVAPIVLVSPGHHRSVCQDRREGAVGGVDPLHVVQHGSDSAAVTAEAPLAPGDHSAIHPQSRKGAAGGKDLLWGADKTRARELRASPTSEPSSLTWPPSS